MKYRLLPSEAEWAWEEAKRRQSASNIRQLKSRRDEFEEELRGIVSEYVVAKFWGGEFDAELYADRGDAPQADTHIGHMSVSIKSTYYFGNATLVIEPFRTACDAYVLVSVDTRTADVHVRGFATQKEVRSRRPLPFMGAKNKTHNIPCSELRDMPDVELIEHGWRPKIRCEKLIWERPSTGFWYSDESAKIRRSQAED